MPFKPSIDPFSPDTNRTTATDPSVPQLATFAGDPDPIWWTG